MCTSPVFPPGNSTNAPKFLIPVTFPITLLPTSTDILIYYPPNYHLLSIYNNTIKKKNNHYNIVTIILPALLFQHFLRLRSEERRVGKECRLLWWEVR